MSRLFPDILTPALLEEIAGHAVREPVGLVTASGGQSQGNRRHLFLVEHGAPRPFAIVKRLNTGPDPGVDRARLAMHRIRDSADPVLAASCPRTWGPFALQDGALITIQACVAAPSIHAQQRLTFRPRTAARRHFSRVAPWLTRFGKATMIERTLDDTLLDLHFLQPLREYATRCGDEAASQHVERTAAAARLYLGRAIPFTAEHGDFWPSNILVPPHGHHIYVVDWEHYSEEAPAGFDALLFCTTYALDLAWRPLMWVDPATALRRTFVEQTWFADVARGLLQQYCTALGLEPGLLALLLEVLFARMALRQQGSMTDMNAPTGQVWSSALAAWWTCPEDGWFHAWAASPRS